MKITYFIMLLLACGYSTICPAQRSFFLANNSAGIYKTFSDFQNGYPQQSMPAHTHQYSIWPRGFFTYDGIKINTPDSTFNLPVKDIWGYTDHKGRLIRIFEEKQFKVLCDKGIIVYITYSPTRVAYYFSESLDAPIHRLKQKELLKVYEKDSLLSLRIKNTHKKHYLIWNDKEQMYFINQMFNPGSPGSKPHPVESQSPPL